MPGMGNATPAVAPISSLSLPPDPEGAEISSIPDHLRLSQILSSLCCDSTTQSGVPGPGRAHRANQPGQEYPETSCQGRRKRRAQESQQLLRSGRVGPPELWEGGWNCPELAEPSAAPSEALWEQIGVFLFLFHI